MLSKHGPMPTGIYVLRRTPVRPVIEAMSVADDSLLFCNKSGSYTTANVEIAQGTVQHIKFNIQEDNEKERIMWVRIEVKCKNESFYVIPVLIRQGQKVGIIFVDCVHIPNTRLCTLRDLTLDFVAKSRTLFHKRHIGRLLHKPSTFNLGVALVDAPNDNSIIDPPPLDQFHHCCSVCVRSVTQLDSDTYLHLYRNGQRCFHQCIPMGLNCAEQQSMQRRYQEECARGATRWSGMCKSISTQACR